MKKLNKKGFVLVETLIVTVFVVTLFIIVYQTTVPALGEYEQQNKYDDIDSVYYANLYKQMITRYANIEEIDKYLLNANYLDVTNCDGKIGTINIYKDVEYCNLVKDSIKIGENDRVLVTKYDITNFKNEVNSDVNFDSGAYSNFRNYLNTVATQQERFYSTNPLTNLNGKYRLFLIRQISETDSSVTRRYANIGIYIGNYPRYIQGEPIKYKVTNSQELSFYVLKNSNSTEANVTLILADNLKSGSNYITTKFNNTAVAPTNIYDDWGWRTNKSTTDASTVSNNIGNPDLVLTALKNATNGWTNVPTFGEYTYDANDCQPYPKEAGKDCSIAVGTDKCKLCEYNYSINYNGYRARLLEASEILSIIGCREDQAVCFDKNSAFETPFDTTELGWLSNNLTGDQGYWTADVVINSNLYAWSIQNGKVVPTYLAKTTQTAVNTMTISNPNIGIRPVITVPKGTINASGNFVANSNLRRG